MEVAPETEGHMPLNELLRRAGLAGIEGGTVSVSSVTSDSRRVKRGALFVALASTPVEAARHMDEARRRGAAAVACASDRVVPEGMPWIVLDHPRRDYGLLCAAVHGHPAGFLKIVGVTGTNGKTTSTMMVSSILNQTGLSCGLIGTVRNELGGLKEAATMTTPVAEDLQGMMAEMKNRSLQALALEVSSHGLDQERLAGTELAVAAFTNMARDHLDYHQTLEAYHRSKRRLLEYLAPDGTVILNGDAPEYPVIESLVPAGHRMLRYSLGDCQAAEVKGSILDMTLEGMELEINLEGQVLRCRTPIIGAHNAANILLAVAACHSLGVAGEDLVCGIDSLQQVEGRFEVLDVSAGFRVIVDYAHSPDAFETMLATLRALTPGRLHVLFGCGGERDQGKRAEMGRIASCLADHVMLTDDNPRGENPDRIVMDIKSGMDMGHSVPYIPDRREAILHVLDQAQDHDVVLLAGKGHEKEQILGDRVVEHVDREVVQDWAAFRDGRKGKAP